MRDGVSASLVGDFDQALGDERARDGSAQEVLTFVDRVTPEHRKHKVANKLLLDIFDEDVSCAGGFGFCARGFDIFALAQVRRKSDYLAVIGFLQPFQDCGRVQSAGVGEHYLLDVRHGSNRENKSALV